MEKELVALRDGVGDVPHRGEGNGSAPGLGGHNPNGRMDGEGVIREKPVESPEVGHSDVSAAIVL